MNHVLHIPTDDMPATAGLLRTVFGTYPVALQPAIASRYAEPMGCTHMESALLGVDYVKLLIAGGQKLPVLTLVGPENGLAALWLRWLKEVVHVPQRHNLLSDAQKPHDDRGLVLWNGEPDDELLGMLEAIQRTSSLCFFPDDLARHHHVAFYPALCIRCDRAPDAERFRTFHWVRFVGDRVLKADEMAVLIARLTIEYPAFLRFLSAHRFFTKPTTPVWFGPDQYCEPVDETNEQAA